MKEESIFHVKVNYDEALQSKRDILSAERDFLNILRIIRKYELLRREELTIKLKIQNKIRDLKANITRMNNVLPKVKLPEILKKKTEIDKKEVEDETTKIQARIRRRENEDELEAQLREIQEKLKKLE